MKMILPICVVVLLVAGCCGVKERLYTQSELDEAVARASKIAETRAYLDASKNRCVKCGRNFVKWYCAIGGSGGEMTECLRRCDRAVAECRQKIRQYNDECRKNLLRYKDGEGCLADYKDYIPDELPKQETEDEP